MEDLTSNSDFIFYRNNEGAINIQIMVVGETLWANQKQIAEIFGVEPHTINYHLKEIFNSKELDENATTRKIRIVQSEGKKSVSREVLFYNLDVIISVGYRVNSYQATQFRIWSNKILKEYLIKGFVLDDERLKQGKNIFGKDYFDELLQRIKEIRASERRFYQKITDIYALSADYDKNSPTTQTFFATVQNKLHFAITHFTAAEIIKFRADSSAPHMGLTSWKNSPEGKILKTDVSIAKNYLTEREIDELNSMVVMYLDYAELQAKRNKIMKMSDWVERLDGFLKFNEYDVLDDKGKMRSDIAKSLAEKEFEKFRIAQDKEYVSDFDRVIENMKINRVLPKEEY